MLNASASGSTIAAPQKSPSHHVRDTRRIDEAGITWYSARDSGPMIALTAVAAVNAANTPATPVADRRAGPSRYEPAQEHHSA